MMTIRWICDQLVRERQPALENVVAHAVHRLKHPIKFRARYTKLSANKIRPKVQLMEICLDKLSDIIQRRHGLGLGNRVSAIGRRSGKGRDERRGSVRCCTSIR